MKFKAVLLLFLFHLNSFGQDSIVSKISNKSNPILFSEFYFGGAGSDNGGLWLLGYNLNYQFNDKDFLTARFSGLLGIYDNYTLLAPTLILPFSDRKETQQEYALLYGKRWVKENVSFSISSGVSHTDRVYYKKVDEYYEKLNQDYFGIPIELNVKWFKAEKSRFRAYYGLIPIGSRRVSFGRSIGFKITGNFAKNDYLGLAVTYGFGWHKNY